MNILEVKNLVKNYGSVEAVKGVTFSVKAGRCLGLLGPNGAGKTTTVEMLEGILAPSSGQILYKGTAVGSAFKEQVGIQFQQTALQDFLTVSETLDLFLGLYPKTASRDDLIKKCHLEDILKRDAKKLSGGQKQRLLLALALVNDPELIFLDEPTTGLDPQSRRYFWDLVRDIKSREKTLVLTTHYMEEAYELCDELVIMDQGKIIAQGTPRELLDQHFQSVTLHFPLETGRLLSQKGYEVKAGDSGATMQSSDLEKTLKEWLTLGVSMVGLEVKAQTLEDLFLKLTGRELRADAQ